MDAKLFSIANRLSSNVGTQPIQRLAKTLIGDASTSKTYYTGRSSKVSLYSKISPLGSPSVSVVPELDHWVEKGNRVRVGELQRIILDLRKRKRFSQALEVSEWMNKKGICIFTPSQHARQLDLIGRVRGFQFAESYFNSLMEQDKTDKTYGALLSCYVRQRVTDESLSHLQKMKEKGFASSPLTYNDIMCLYTNIGQHEKVPDVLREMKESNVPPDNYSYRICINSYGARSDIEGMERLLKEMESQSHIIMDWNTYAIAANFYIKAGLTDKVFDALKQSEERLDKKDGLGYNHLISLYAKMGKKADVLRLWDLEKSACKKCINRDYITMLESLVRLDELEEAEELLKDWESSGNCYDFRVPNVVLIGYFRKHWFEKAEAMLEDLMDKGKATNPNSWGVVAAGYLDKGKMMKAVDCMKVAFSLYVDGKGWKPNPRVITDILSWLGDEGSVEEVEAFVFSLRTVVSMDRQMYHALMKANIRDGKDVNELLNSMKADKIEEDGETEKILGMRQKNEQ
ncbi:pentatricopeptide repeat-containing protein At4g21705, mitochondrial [Malania oleifera]|uniref:pentatricopeptide repeat-containing protein At4g21705, mitochondrial n=1 Tax=Malania oleifera TaxID=397392 RepID=UPI0025AE648F|nr:pentatricopeptide repeat-containing protein At4g21705, mitochondrial [Malania oleifera]